MAEKKGNVKKEKKDKGNGFNIIIIILLLLILIGGAAFAGFFIFFKNNPTQAVNPNVNPGSVQLLIEETIFDLGEFTVNLADEGGRRYLKAKVSIGYDAKNKKLVKEIDDSKKTIMRDAVNTVLNSKTTAEMTVEGREKLKKELIDKINPLLKNGRLNSVYFSDILIQ